MISGRAGEGKTTFATMCRDYLIKKGHDATIISFAQAVKDTAKTMNWDGNKDAKGRKLLTVIGGAGRDYNESTWANIAVERIMEWYAKNEEGFVFIDDWRFVNEGNVITEIFIPVLKLRIIRPKEFHLLLNTPLYNDISEIGLPEFSSDGKWPDTNFYDSGIFNSTDLEGLKNTAHQFVDRTLLGGRE